MTIARIFVSATLVVLVLGSPTGAPAQETPPSFRFDSVSASRPSRADDVRRRAQSDARKRFPNLIRQARKLDDGADRVRGLMMLADAASERDPALARRLYVEAIDASRSLRTEPSMAQERRSIISFAIGGTSPTASGRFRHTTASNLAQPLVTGHLDPRLPRNSH